MARARSYSEDTKQALATWVENGANSEPNQTVANLIDDLAIAGETCYAWKQLKKLVAWKLRSTISSLTKDKPISEVIDGVPFDKRYDRLLKRLDDFSAPPFTIQRLCELLLGTSPYAAEPRKYVFAVEKLVYVSSTIPVLAPADYDSTVVALDKAMRAAAEQARIAAEATAAAIASAAASGASSVATRRPAAADDVDMS